VAVGRCWVRAGDGEDHAWPGGAAGGRMRVEAEAAAARRAAVQSVVQNFCEVSDATDAWEKTLATV
jgi:hypothetical protein